MKRIALSFAVSFIVLPSTASAQQPAARGPMSFDVAGVRLGMPYSQAKAALAGAYSCKEEGKRVTFAEDLEDEVKRRRGQAAVRWGGSGPGMLTCKGPNSESLSIDFAQDRIGPVVDDLVLHVQTRIVAEADMLRQLATKFGKPTTGTIGAGAWCDPGYRCHSAVLVSEGPAFSVRATGDAVVVAGSRGSRADRARAAALAAEADRLAPKKARVAL